MTLRDLLVAVIPRDWTGDQALTAVNALQQAIDAIWAVHGDRMGAVLFEPLDDEDDSPF